MNENNSNSPAQGLVSNLKEYPCYPCTWFTLRFEEVAIVPHCAKNGFWIPPEACAFKNFQGAN